MALADDIRSAVEKAVSTGRETRYSLAKGAGVEYRTLARWLDEDRDIKLSTAASLAAYLGLELRPGGKAPAAKKRPRSK
jgi:hypothetical protein